MRVSGLDKYQYVAGEQARSIKVSDHSLWYKVFGLGF